MLLLGIVLHVQQCRESGRHADLAMDMSGYTTSDEKKSHTVHVALEFNKS